MTRTLESIDHLQYYLSVWAYFSKKLVVLEKSLDHKQIEGETYFLKSVNVHIPHLYYGKVL